MLRAPEITNFSFRVLTSSQPAHAVSTPGSSRGRRRAMDVARDASCSRASERIAVAGEFRASIGLVSTTSVISLNLHPTSSQL